MALWQRTFKKIRPLKIFFFQTALILGPSEIIFTEGYESTSTFFFIIVTINEL